jgi:hypothetical protein
MVPDARVGTAQHITRVSADVLLGITCHSKSTTAGTAGAAAAPKLAWACQGSSGAAVWSTTMSQVLLLICIFLAMSVCCFSVLLHVHKHLCVYTSVHSGS